MSDVEVKISGEASGFRRAMQEVAQSAKDGAGGVESSFGGLGKVFSGLEGKIAGIAAMLGGGALFKESVETAAKFTEESMKFGRALGISATEAAFLSESLDAGQTSQEEFIGAAQKLTKQVRTNESALNDMGLKTRDAAGHLIPLNKLTIDAIDVLKGYKEGTDRAIAAQVIFGKGFELTSDLINVNSKSVKELTEFQRALGAVVGEENVNDWQAFDDSGDKVHLTLKALKISIGNALIPALTDMGNWFSSIGPAAVTVIKGAFGGLVATFHLVTTGVTVLWETINAMVVTVAEPIRALGASIGKALSGDWSGAADEISGIGGVISGAWGNAFETMAAKAQNTRDRIWSLFAGPTDIATPDNGGKSAKGLIQPATDKNKKEKEGPESYMQYYEAALSQEKRLASERDALRGYSKEEELIYWQTILQYADLKGKDRLAIESKVSGLIVDIKRNEAKQAQALDTENARSHDALAMGRVEAERAAAQVSLDLGLITQSQFLALEEQFEQKRYEIQRSALEERIKLLEKDPNTNPVEFVRIKNQMLELEQQYQLKRQQLHGQIQQADMQTMVGLSNRMAGLWDKGLQSMMNGTLTWRNAFKAIGTELAAWFAMDVVGKQVKSWIAGEALKIAQKMGFVAVEKTIEAASSATTVGVKATEATAVVGANAAEAASGAAASVASIPFIGWAMAAGVFAATMAMVMGATSSIKSASGGYDIPSGINPITQLHEEEMVLPAKHANAIRDMADGNGGGNSGGVVSFTVHAVDAQSVARLFKDNGHHLAAALKQQVRNFNTGR